MKKLLVAIIAVAFAAGLSAQTAGDKPNKKADKQAGKQTITKEARLLRRDMVKKYDLNGDKKLDADELAKISADDKQKMEDAGIWPSERKANKIKQQKQKQNQPR
jgi:Ni/Co efflux regulator RcnB